MARIGQWRWWFAVAALVVSGAAPSLGRASSITFAGFAYAGNADSIDARFKYSKRYEKSILQQGGTIAALLRQALAGRQYPFDLNTSENISSRGDEVLVTALTVTQETVSEETFGSVHKLFVQIRAQALIVDFATKKIRRTYPLSFAYFDVLDHAANDEEIDERVSKTYQGAQGKEGIFARYATALSKATLPHNGDLFLQITRVTISPDAAAAIRPEMATHPGAPESWVADQFGEALNSNAGVALFPYSAGFAIGGVMQMKLNDTDFNLQFPDPDWEIGIDLTGVKKVTYAENAVGTSYVYGAYATVRIAQRGAARAIFEAQFKNGEVKVVPASQAYVEDLPAYEDSIRGLFGKLADVLGGQDLPWLKTAAVTPNIGPQIIAARGLLAKCK